MMRLKKSAFILFLLLGCAAIADAQEKSAVNWLSFEALSDSLAVQEKKVFIDFYTDWCSYCRKMDRVVFTKQEVIETLNKDYYAVRFNAESTDTTYFEGQPYYNDQVDKSRKPLHQLAQLLALREGEFVAPTMIVLHQDFTVKQRYFEYLDSKKLLKALE